MDAQFADFADRNPGGGSVRWLGDHEKSVGYAPGVAVDWKDRAAIGIWTDDDVDAYIAARR